MLVDSEDWAVGSMVWIECATAVWELGSVVEHTGSNLKVRCVGHPGQSSERDQGISPAGTVKQLDLGFDQVFPADTSNVGCPDLTALLHLTEPSILQGLDERAQSNQSSVKIVTCTCTNEHAFTVYQTTHPSQIHQHGNRFSSSQPLQAHSRTEYIGLPRADLGLVRYWPE